jgi:hypothetical protein
LNRIKTKPRRNPEDHMYLEHEEDEEKPSKCMVKLVRKPGNVAS